MNEGNQQKSVGVITMYRRNYGAFLQAYALQRVLEGCGYRAELIRYDYYRDRTLLNVPLHHARRPLYFIRRILGSIRRMAKTRRRDRVFSACIKEYLRESEGYYRTYRELKANPPRYDLYLTGSDQVFNPRLSRQAAQARLLFFAPGERASYAASAGTSDFPEDYRAMLNRALSEFRAVSVREEALKDYLNREMNIPAERHLDPTLLLSADDWRRFARHAGPNEPYLLFYRASAQPELVELAEQLSRELDLPVYAADGSEKFSRQLPRRNILRPDEWVGAFANAQYVVTNSFHGLSFCANLHKKVAVLPPKKDSERLLNLLTACKLTRLLDSTPITDEELSTLYAPTDARLARERARSLEYLRGLGDF